MKKSYKLIFIILFLFFTFQTVFSEEEDYCKIEGVPNEVVGGETVNFKIDVKLARKIRSETSTWYIPILNLAAGIIVGAVIIASEILTGGLSTFLVVGGLSAAALNIYVGLTGIAGIMWGIKGEIEVCIPIEYNERGSQCEKYSIPNSILSKEELERGTQREITITIPKGCDALGEIRMIVKTEKPLFSSTDTYCGKNFFVYGNGKYNLKMKMKIGNEEEDITGKEVQFEPFACIIESPEKFKGKKVKKVEGFCEFPVLIEVSPWPSLVGDKSDKCNVKWNIISKDNTVIELKLENKYISGIVKAGNGLVDAKVSLETRRHHVFGLHSDFEYYPSSLFEIKSRFIPVTLAEINLNSIPTDRNLKLYGSIPSPNRSEGSILLKKETLRVPPGTPVSIDVYDKNDEKISQKYVGKIYIVEIIDEKNNKGKIVDTPVYEPINKVRKFVALYADQQGYQYKSEQALTIQWTNDIRIELSPSEDIKLDPSTDFEVIANITSLDVVYTLEELSGRAWFIQVGDGWVKREFDVEGFYFTFLWDGVDASQCTKRKGLNLFSLNLSTKPPTGFNSYGMEGNAILQFVAKRLPSSTEYLATSKAINVEPKEIILDGVRKYSVLSGCGSKFESYCYLRYCPPKIPVPTDMKENELRLQAISRLGDIVDSGQENAKLEVATGVSVEFNIFYCDPNKDKPVTETYVETEKCRIIINPKDANVVEIREDGVKMTLGAKEVISVKEGTRSFFAKLKGSEGNESKTITISWKKPKLTMSPDPSKTQDIILPSGESATITVSSDIPVFSNLIDAYCNPFLSGIFKDCENKAGGIMFGMSKGLDAPTLVTPILYNLGISWIYYSEYYSAVMKMMEKYIPPLCYDITSNSVSVTFSRGEEDENCSEEVELVASYTGGEFEENTLLKIKVTPFICKDKHGKEWYTLNCFGGKIKKGSEKGGGGGDGGKSYIIKSLEFKNQGINAFSLPFKPEKIEFNENCRIERIQSEKIRNKNCKLDIVYYNPTTGWECVDLSKGFEPLIGYFVNISFVGSSKCKIDFAYTEPQNVPDIPDFTKDVSVYFFGVGKEVDSADIKGKISQKIGKNVGIVKCGGYDFSSSEICQNGVASQKLVPFEVYSLVFPQQ